MSKLAALKQVLKSLVALALALALAEIAVGYLVPLRDVGPSFSRYDPALGQSLRPGVTTVRTAREFTMRLSTNAHGFRGPESGSLLRGGILFLGDSFTMGYGVNDGEEFPALVAAKIKQASPKADLPVINAGIGNSGNGRWVKLLDQMGGSLAPRVVVMQVLENDFADNLQERLFDLAPDGTLRELAVPKPGLGHRFQAIIEAIPGLPSSNLIALARQARLPQFRVATEAPAAAEAQPPGELSPGDILTLRIIERALAICRANGWPVLGVSIGLHGVQQAAIRQMFLKSGAEVLELPGKNARPDLYYKIDGHWNAAGQADAAVHVFERLKLMGAVGH